jgi:predicted Zn-dependent protease
MADNPRIEELRRRVQADPASIAFAALAEEFRRMGRYDEAVETCRAGLQRHPAYLSARVTLGRALIETGDFEAAREELDTVLRSAPENLAAIRGLAQINERLGHSTAMDPLLADIMENHHAEQIRVAALAPPPPPPAPEPPPVSLAPEPPFSMEPEPAISMEP